MFVQIIQGKVRDRDEVDHQFGRWLDDLAPSAIGWEGTTSGFTDDGRFVAVVRFRSEDEARRNSDRPEQGEWWSRTEPAFDEVEFADSGDVETWRGGPSDEAGFVQVIQGRVLDAAKRRELQPRVERWLATNRPDVVGGLIAFHDGDRFTQVVYFTDERSAREGEAREPDEEGRALLEDFTAAVQDVSYIDLHDVRHDRRR